MEGRLQRAHDDDEVIGGLSLPLSLCVFLLARYNRRCLASFLALNAGSLGTSCAVSHCAVPAIPDWQRAWRKLVVWIICGWAGTSPFSGSTGAAFFCTRRAIQGRHAFRQVCCGRTLASERDIRGLRSAWRDAWRRPHTFFPSRPLPQIYAPLAPPLAQDS